LFKDAAMKSALFATAALMLGLTACAPLPEMSSSLGFSGPLPATRWDHRPEADDWTRATLEALKSEGAVLLSSTPTDIDTYCPGYETASNDERAAFWVGMFSAIAKYESTWNPSAKGGGGRYLGLLQISPATARYVGCDSKGLLDGATNLDCAVRIAANRVPSSAVAGLTTDWGPMHDRSKRAEVAAWTSAQSYCQPDN
jgi:Transglycosylase SLT domain